MDKLIRRLLLASAFLCSSSVAEACIVRVPPFSWVNGDFDAIAVGVVEKAAYNGNSRLDWSGTARLTDTLIGSPDVSVVSFGYDGGLVGGCDNGWLEPPSAGEKWVFYIRGNGVLGIPLSMALERDGRVFFNMIGK